MSEKLLYWIWLTTELEFSHAKISKIYRKFTPEEAFSLSPDELVGFGVPRDVAESLSGRDLTRARKIVERCEELGINIITANSRYYPRQLEILRDKPYIIYTKGDIACLKNKTAAIVGTRRSTQRGEELALKTAERLISEGVTLISGAADGIDSVAAKASVEKGVPFAAVIGVDIDKYYPASNKRIIDKIAGNGVVISEYPPFTNARYFADRNRIIAGLSDEVYVVEAPDESGALITGRIALRYRIPVYASDVEGVSFEGCRELIKKGASAFGGEKMKKEKKPPVLDGTRLYIYERLKEKSVGEEELVDSEHPITEVLTALTELELDGIIKALPGGKYKLTE